MQIIPLQSVASQTLTVTLNGQIVSLSIYAFNTPPTLVQVVDGSGNAVADGNGFPVTALQGNADPSLYVDITLNGALIVSGKLIAILQPLLTTAAYQGFSGELVFVDTENLGIQNSTQPLYAGLGSQYQLVYLAPSDL